MLKIVAVPRRRAARSWALAALVVGSSLCALAPAYAQSPIAGPDRVDRPALRAPRRHPRRSRRAGNVQRYESRTFTNARLDGVVVDGASVPSTRFSPAWRSYLGKSVTLDDVNKIIDAVAAEYVDTDVALYAVSVGEQGLSNGVLHLRAVESRVGSIVLEPDPRVHVSHLVDRLARPLLRERPLRRSSLSALVAQLQEVPGLSADVRVLPGDEAGAVALHIALHQPAAQVSVGVNNQGQAGLGRAQADASLTLNSLFREGDQTLFSTLVSPGTARLRYYAVAHSERLGSATLQANFGYLHTKLGDISGHAYSSGLTLSQPLFRHGDQLVTGSASIDGVNVDNAFVGETFSSDRTRAVRASLTYAGGVGSNTWTLSTAVSQGLDIFGARVASPLESTLAFSKLTYAFAFDRALGDLWVARLRSQGQLAFDRLPSVELFALGGPTAGRGFDSVTAVGDSGAYGSLELARTFSATSHQPFRPAEVYAFTDGGVSRYRGRYGFAGVSQSLADVGVGVRATLLPKAVLEVEGAEAVERRLDFYRSTPRLNVALRFTL